MLATWLSLLNRPRSPSMGNAARWFWTAGYLAFLLHLWAAFAFVHHWSHIVALEDTARRTREIVGLDWGEGIWANYAFALIWGGDALWWWLRPSSRAQRSVVIDRIV